MTTNNGPRRRTAGQRVGISALALALWLGSLLALQSCASGPSDPDDPPLINLHYWPAW